MVEAGCITAAAQRGHLGSLAPVFGLQWQGAPGLFLDFRGTRPSPASLPFAHITVLLFMRLPGAQF